MQKLFLSLEKYTIYALLVLYPVFVLSSFNNPYAVPKEILLVGATSLALLFWVARTITSGSFSFKIGKFDLAVFLVMLSYVVSTIFRTQNKAEAFFLPGTTTFLLASAVLYYLINQLDKRSKSGVIYSLLLSSVLLSVSILFTEVGFWTKIPQLPAFVKDPGFNAFGSNLPALIYMISTFILSFTLIFKENDAIRKLFIGVSAAVILLGGIILAKNALPGKSQAIQLADFQTSWAVGIETLKQSPILGIGPGNYLTAFNMFRPTSYNQTPLWLVRFTTARNFYLTTLTETGFIGLFAFAVLFIAIYRVLRNGLRFSIEGAQVVSLIEKLSLTSLLVLFFLFPATPNIVTLLFVFLALLSSSEEKSVNMVTSSKAAGVLISLPVVIGVVLLGYFGLKAIRAESMFQQAILAIADNNAQTTYNNMQSAITEYNRVDRYHASLAQVDMALATSIANKKNITDADKTTVTQLVQQAINEGKATVALNPQRSGNWEVLAQIYRSIMPFAQGADQFAIQTYTQAVALDPTNPNLRIALGGVYYALGNFDNAIDAFKLAALAKPDLANAHYNLAIAYREKKEYDNAITEMNNVLALVDKKSQDYTLAQNVLADLQKNKPSSAKVTDGQSPQLTPPQPVPASNIKPPITLPKEATPPAATKQ
jgi:tetratricopeptide (TPR) repeat protein